MSQAVTTEGIILGRTNFGEADRILTVLTPGHGKRRLMVKGVRKERSKLAGGIELFCISYISYIPGRGEIDTLISTRLKKNYSHIVKDVQRTMLGYELLKRLNRATEDATGEEYFKLLQHTLAALDENALALELVELWFNAQLLKLGGHQPNLATDTAGDKLEADKKYSLDVEHMVFASGEQGRYTAKHIKLLRLVFGSTDPLPLKNVQSIDTVLPAVQNLVTSMLKQFIRV